VTLQSDEQVLSIIKQADDAFHERKKTSFEKRKQLFLKMADDIDDRNEELARLETIEMGRLYSVAKQ
jgi:acyl-CoA reductase-like NAD-dependent aldehyde dehydrogenase